MVDSQIVANELQKPVALEVKLLDLVTRVVPAAFFLMVLAQKCNELYAFIVSGQALGDAAASWKFFADVVSRSSTILFVALLSILFIIRLSPIKKAKGVSPRVLAVAGTFSMALVTFFPRANLSLTQTVIASFLSLVGTGLSVFALAHLGRSFSVMAEARRLVTSGPYRIMRHPLYVFESVASLGILLQFFSSYTALIYLAHCFLQLQRMKKEEAVLETVFPEYQTYKLKTARVIPGVY
ncbi:MAG TPA: isoprenylcysteine carboxylmethyltransferase family protein [Pyrinomonadaceae bacterium]|nr:isoprenylcysteine carboxylmethyltransferase family protein [Pyrinomonadaceae bacterium]